MPLFGVDAPALESASSESISSHQTLPQLDGNSDSAAANHEMDLDYTRVTGVQVPALRSAWLAEHDPAKRQAAAAALIHAVISLQDGNGEGPFQDIFDEVIRDGLPKYELTTPKGFQSLRLKPLFQFPQWQDEFYPDRALFRRITKNRFEAWNWKSGWLFDGEGKLLNSVTVPRRDGHGQKWLGAFLADGSWMTTDLWEDDKQLNAFTPEAKWKWELDGTDIVDRISHAKLLPDGQTPESSIGWARADRSGHNWLISVGTDETRAYALVGLGGEVHPLSDKTNLWNLVFPLAMGVRGTDNKSYILSQDGRRVLIRTGTYHNIGVFWPIFSLPNRGNVVIPSGYFDFGFWPNSHRIFVQADYSPHQIWIFGPNGKYEGQVEASYLGEADNGRDILVQNGNGEVLRISVQGANLIVAACRSFLWSDGTPAIPVALYDDLHCGFFLRGSNLQRTSEDVLERRGTANVVLASWRSRGSP